ncbi:MAG: hypothetical protein WBO49_01315 [Candidatus Saccharimonas sp.]
MKHSNKWFIAGCVAFIACLAVLIGWLAPSDEATEEPTDDPTASVSVDPWSDDSEAPQPFVLTEQQRTDIAKVLRVYFATPSQRKETPVSVKPLVTDDFADTLAHQWDGLMPGTKVAIKALKFVDSAIVDGERRANATLTLVTTYTDKSKATERWTASVLLAADGRVSDIEDFPGEG